MNKRYIATKLGCGARNVVVGIIGSGVIAASYAHPAMATNYAHQFDIANCGAYAFDRYKIERKKPGGEWHQVDTIEKKVSSDHAICFDISGYTDDDGNARFNEGDQSRVVVYIFLGETVKCDSTNYPPLDTDEASTQDSEDYRRRLVMRGDTFTNNGCRSIEYREVLPHEQCRQNGSVREIKCKG